jgi:hypothetical protein
MSLGRSCVLVGERDHAKPLQSAAEALWWLPRSVYGLRAPRACDPPCARRVANINAAPAPTSRPDTVGLGNASHNVSMLEPTDRGVYGAFRSSGAAELFVSPSDELSAHLRNVQKAV